MKLEDVPDGSAAVEKVSFLDWFQLLVFGDLIDAFNFQTESREHMDDYELSGTFGIPGDVSSEDQALTEFQDGHWTDLIKLFRALQVSFEPRHFGLSIAMPYHSEDVHCIKGNSHGQ